MVYLYFYDDCCFDNNSIYNKTIIEEAMDCLDSISYCNLDNQAESIILFFRKDSLVSFMKSDIKNCLLINDIFFIILKAFHIKMIFNFVHLVRSLDEIDLKRIKLNSKRVSLFS